MRNGWVSYKLYLCPVILRVYFHHQHFYQLYAQFQHAGFPTPLDFGRGQITTWKFLTALDQIILFVISEVIYEFIYFLFKRLSIIQAIYYLTHEKSFLSTCSNTNVFEEASKIVRIVIVQMESFEKNSECDCSNAIVQIFWGGTFFVGTNLQTSGG